MGNSYGQFITSLKGKKLLIFGTGALFNNFVYYYEELLNDIAFLIDNKYDAEGYLSINGLTIKVMPPEMILNYDIDQYVVLFCSQYASEMKKQLDRYVGKNYEFYTYPLVTLDEPMGEKNIISRVIMPLESLMKEYNMLSQVLNITECLDKKILYKRIIDGNTVMLPRLVIVLTSRCTLRCKECDNLMRHFKKPQDLDSDKIICSLQKIADAVDVLPCCELIGGEPFLAGKIDRVLNFLINEKKVCKIEITTNGTVIPKKETIELLKNHKVTIRLSNYNNVVDQSRFVECMESNGVNMNFLPEGMWIANGDVEKRNRDYDILLQQYDRCLSGKVCRTLWEDKLFVCARAASLAGIGCIDDEQALVIGTSDCLRNDMIEFLCKPLINACEYCDNESEMERMVPPAEQLL